MHSVIANLMLDSDVFVNARLIKGLFANRTRSVQRTLFIGRNERFFMLQTNVTSQTGSVNKYLSTILAFLWHCIVFSFFMPIKVSLGSKYLRYDE